jgi:hypothetical protein
MVKGYRQMKIDEIDWQLGKVHIFENGVIITRGAAEELTVPYRALTDLIFTLANVEQDRTLGEIDELSETSKH